MFLEQDAACEDLSAGILKHRQRVTALLSRINE